MRSSIDKDGVQMVDLDWAKQTYPNLNWQKIEKRFSSDDKNDINYNLIALYDLQYCKELYARGIELDDCEYNDSTECSVCKAVLLPDDEAYSDAETGESLCDVHSEYDDDKGGYVKYV